MPRAAAPWKPYGHFAGHAGVLHTVAKTWSTSVSLGISTGSGAMSAAMGASTSGGRGHGKDGHGAGTARSFGGCVRGSDDFPSCVPDGARRSLHFTEKSAAAGRCIIMPEERLEEEGHGPDAVELINGVFITTAAH